MSHETCPTSAFKKYHHQDGSYFNNSHKQCHELENSHEFPEKLLLLADQAWMELLKEKIKRFSLVIPNNETFSIHIRLLH